MPSWVVTVSKLVVDTVGAATVVTVGALTELTKPTEALRWSRLFGQLPGRNKLKAGGRLLV